MFLYLASNPRYKITGKGKIGSTIDLYSRRSTYQTGCPPGGLPPEELDYLIIWETTASTREELYDFEDEVHDAFITNRMMRHIPNDTEWFQFENEKEMLERVNTYITSRTYFKRLVSISEVKSITKPQKYLQRPTPRNRNIIKESHKRNRLLTELQGPVIAKIQNFLNDKSSGAYIICPCGSGKTRITCIAINGLIRVVVCCPREQIQRQWKEQLLLHSNFSETDIFVVGGNTTTDPSIIHEILSKDRFCIITTYASSHLLLDGISENVQLLVLDEAHHMAGIVAKASKGQGKTRRLLKKATDLSIKRLSLTFTPRFVSSETDDNLEYMSMDDAKIFGTKIAELKLRDLINAGVLPDYRVWSIRDEANVARGILGKAEEILGVWQAKHIIRIGDSKIEKYILHHLILFVSTLEEVDILFRYFEMKTDDRTEVLFVKGGDELKGPLKRFETSERAILINCKVLGEGVDIPCANAIGIMYPKKARGEITQMILRAGRWYKNKPIFHILIPSLENEDLSGFEEVLCALASCDGELFDEIVYRSRSERKFVGGVGKSKFPTEKIPERIMIETFGSSLGDIKKCFRNIRCALFTRNERHRVQNLCKENNITTKVGYDFLRIDYPDLPFDPRLKNVSWYDFLNESNLRISPKQFVKEVIIPNNLRVSYRYDEWRESQSLEMRKGLPSIQNISDGYFGQHLHEFKTLIKKYQSSKTRRRRGETES